MRSCSGRVQVPAYNSWRDEDQDMGKLSQSDRINMDIRLRREIAMYGFSSILCSFFILISTQFILHFSQSHLVYYWHLCLILAKVKLLFFGGFEKNR